MIPRKPPLSERTVRDLADESRGGGLGQNLLERYIALRRRGLLMPILTAAGSDGYFVATNLLDLWGSKKYVSVWELAAQIEELEGRDAAQVDAA
jgi:hypothetical protein